MFRFSNTFAHKTPHKTNTFIMLYYVSSNCAIVSRSKQFNGTEPMKTYQFNFVKQFADIDDVTPEDLAYIMDNQPWSGSDYEYDDFEVDGE